MHKLFWNQSCEMSYRLHRANFLNQILPHGKCINCDKFNTWIKWNWCKWLLHGVKSIKYGWFKDKTTSKLVEFTQKLLSFTKLRGLLFNSLEKLAIWLNKTEGRGGSRAVYTIYIRLSISWNHATLQQVF